MNSEKIGSLIRSLRQEKNMTQKQLADQLCVSDKAISKWERGQGCPEISLLRDLASILEINIERMLEGELSPNEFVGGNMKNTKYYICPVCGNISLCTGKAEVSCCGRKLAEAVLKKAAPDQKLIIENVENDWYITSDHPMTKQQYISFVAFATGGSIQVFKQYPEWDLSVRIQRRGHGMLLWYSSTDGLMYQLI